MEKVSAAAVSHPLKRKKNKIQSSIFSRCLLTRKITLMINNIGKNIQETLEECIQGTYEGKCTNEGYVKPNSCKLITFSNGMIERGIYILFEVLFECDVCFPVEGMLISCVAKNITKAGIRAESDTIIPSPVVIFIAKDHHYSSSYFNSIKEGQKITVRVIGQRFELNDKYVSVIGELVKEPMVGGDKEVKPKLLISDEEEEVGLEEVIEDKI